MRRRIAVTKSTFLLLESNLGTKLKNVLILKGHIRSPDKVEQLKQGDWQETAHQAAVVGQTSPREADARLPEEPGDEVKERLGVCLTKHQLECK